MTPQRASACQEVRGTRSSTVSAQVDPTATFLATPWYGDDEDTPNSCRRLREAITEFEAQGQELDATLLAWGNDLRIEGCEWSNGLARRYQRKGSARDAMQLRKNAYRV